MQDKYSMPGAVSGPFLGLDTHALSSEMSSTDVSGNEYINERYL